MNLFFDLDGTLLDSRARLYRLFQKLVPSSTLSFDEYWSLKRDKIGHREILRERFSFSENVISLFESDWMRNIESPDLIALDKPFAGITDYLIKLRERHTLYLVTARQFKEVVIEQMVQNEWEDIFADIFVTSQKREKFELINEAVVNTSNVDWFIGDTGKDIQTGKQLGLRTAAVLTGFLSKVQLEKYHPDLIVDQVLDLDFNQMCNSK